VNKSKKRIPAIKSELQSGKKPKIQGDPESYHLKNPSWAFSRCDEKKWPLIHSGDWWDTVAPKLQNFETMTWQDILSAGKAHGRGSNSHFVETNNLIKEAQKRLEELRIEDQELMSLRMQGKERLYGILDQGIFYIIWYDKDHVIYPMRK
jgi:hypothetical protein